MRAFTWIGAATTLLLASSLALATPAYADYVTCPPKGGNCQVVVTGTGSAGGQGAGSAGDAGTTVRTCIWAATEVPCSHTLSTGQTGWFNGADGCYYYLEVPQPDPGTPFWGRHQPSDGMVYSTLCYPPDRASAIGYLGVGFVVLAVPPPGFGGGVSPATLAAQAINQLPIHGPQIETAPNTGGAGLVGLPVWLWTDVSGATWGPTSATASVPGLSVTAIARATKIEWDMGDGHSVTCASPGTPYAASFGGQPSPTCGYVYTASSHGTAGGRFTITGVTTWQVTWAGGGQSGVITVTRQSTSTVRIDELQVVTR